MYAAEAVPLWEEHWKEVAGNKDKIFLEVDYARYEQLDYTGELFIAVGRSAGKIVAYWIGFIRGHMHYVDTLHAFNDIYYVATEFRKEGVGSQMFEYVEKELKRRGVKKILNGTKLSHNHAKLFESQGFTPVETVYAKYIGD